MCTQTDSRFAATSGQLNSNTRNIYGRETFAEHPFHDVIPVPAIYK